MQFLGIITIKILQLIIILGDWLSLECLNNKYLIPAKAECGSSLLDLAELLVVIKKL